MLPPAVVFPGQGSQQAGAGRDWLEQPAWHIVERAEAALDIPLAPMLLDPANLNAPGQIVVGGTRDGMAAVAAAAKQAGVRRTRSLAVGGAFHTPLMTSAADELGPVLDAMTFSTPSAPIVANHDGAAHTRPGGWPVHLRTHLVEPVRWEACVRTMVELGAGELIEVGPGTTLTALAARIAPDLTTRNIAVPGDLPIAAEVRT